MEAFLISTLAVAVGEIGDKTQLLALVLAARFRRPIAVILGILCATIANHACAGFCGRLAARHPERGAAALAGRRELSRSRGLVSSA
jgi:putative Ca2+/H+ antiporter (TMEM165/GDT1 family)